jgi:hypothetical protein
VPADDVPELVGDGEALTHDGLVAVDPHDALPARAGRDAGAGVPSGHRRDDDGDAAVVLGDGQDAGQRGAVS